MADRFWAELWINMMFHGICGAYVLQIECMQRSKREPLGQGPGGIFNRHWPFNEIFCRVWFFLKWDAHWDIPSIYADFLYVWHRLQVVQKEENRISATTHSAPLGKFAIRGHCLRCTNLFMAILTRMIESKSDLDSTEQWPVWLREPIFRLQLCANRENITCHDSWHVKPRS